MFQIIVANVSVYIHHIYMDGGHLFKCAASALPPIKTPAAFKTDGMLGETERKSDENSQGRTGFR